MKLMLGMLLIVGGLGGTLMSFSSDIVVQSSLQFINGSEMSVALGLFSILAFLGGITILLATG